MLFIVFVKSLSAMLSNRNLVVYLGLVLALRFTSVTECRKKKLESQNELPCTKQAEADVDVVFGRMSGYGNVSRTFPSNQNELNDYCKGQLEDIKTIDSYAKRCKRGLPKQYFSIMLYTLKGSMQRICKKNSKKAKQFLAASGCIRRVSPHFDACHRNLIHRLHKIKFTENKKKIPYTCCEYYTLRKCFQDSGKGKAKCTDKDMETAEELMESTSSNALNFFCGEYAEDSDKCDKLGTLSLPPSSAKQRPKFVRSISLPRFSIPSQSNRSTNQLNHHRANLIYYLLHH